MTLQNGVDNQESVKVYDYKTYPWILVLEVMSARMHAHTGQLHRDHVVVEVELVLGLLLLLANLASSYLVLLLLRALALPDGGELHGDEAATWGGEESNPLRSGYLPLSELLVAALAAHQRIIGPRL